jgi:1-phosphofructokinase family hexose kinase
MTCRRGRPAGAGGMMIYTVTLNPTLDITYVLEEITLGEPVRALEVLKSPGGKGINVSRALRAMGTDSVAVAMIGGYVGDEVLDLLHGEGLILQIAKIKNDTRTNVIVLGRRDNQELMIRSAGPAVEETETRHVTDLVFKVAQTPEIMVLSGSLPPGIKHDTYYSITEEGKFRGSKVVIDSDGEPLRMGVEAAPYLIKPNLTELEGLAGEKLEGYPEIVEFSRTLNDKGVEMVVVSMGSRGALMVCGDTVLKGTVPMVTEDTVGAGDSMVAGLVTGIVQELALDRVFQRGLAFSLAAVINSGPGLTEPDTFAKAFPQVTVEEITV